MPKKKAKQAAPAKAPMTRRQLSRYARQKRQERMALIFVITTIALVAFIILFGLWREIWSRPGQVVARVGGATITLGDLAAETKYRIKTLDRQIELTSAQVRQAKVQAATDPSMSFLVQYLEQQLQQLQMERLQMGYGQTLLEELVERELIKQEVVRRGATVTAADMDAELARQFQPQPPASQTITDTAGITDTVGLTPTPTATPIPADAWKQRYQETLQTYNITDAEFRRFTLEPIVWRAKLQAMIGATIPTTAEQVHARHILLSTEEEAREVLSLLSPVATTTFEELAQTRSMDEATKEKGGDLGWFPRGVMAPAFEAAAFALDPGQITGVIATTFGFHIIKVEAKDSNRPLTESQITEGKNQAFSTWLEAAKASPDIQRFFDSDKQSWLNKQIPTVGY